MCDASIASVLEVINVQTQTNVPVPPDLREVRRPDSPPDRGRAYGYAVRNRVGAESTSYRLGRRRSPGRHWSFYWRDSQPMAVARR